MNYELLFALGTSAGAIVLAFLYAGVARGAATADQYKVIAEQALKSADQSAAAVSAKEEYVRELEKTVVGSLPPGKLVERLNLLFAAERSRAASTVPTAIRRPGGT